MRTFRSSFFFLTLLLSGFCGEISAKATYLEYPVGKTVEMTITEKGEGTVNILAEPYPANWSQSLRMELTLLDDGAQGSPIDLELIIREYQYEELTDPEFIDTLTMASSDDLAKYLDFVHEQLIDHPLRFHIVKGVSIAETTGAFDEDFYDFLDREYPEDEESTGPEFELDFEFFRQILVQLFHLKDVPLKLHASINEPLLYLDDINEWEDFSEECCEIKDEGSYSISDIKKHHINASWQGTASIESDGDIENITIDGTVRWDRKNALIQDRNVSMEVYAMYHLFDLALIRVNFVKEQKWESTPLKRAG